MQIGDFVNQYHNNITSGEMPTGAKGVEKASSPVSALKAGNIFEGTVNSNNNGQVVLGLSNGQTVSARLDSGISLSEGQSVFFQVKSNDGVTIQIKPVSIGGSSSNPTLLNALDYAGLSVNERTLNMVNTMMREQLPINSENLLAMNRMIQGNPNVSAENIVLMNKYGIPVTHENASMFEAYATNQAQIADDLDAVALSLPKLLTSNLLSSEQQIALNDKIIQIFTEDEGTAVTLDAMTEGMELHTESTNIVSSETTNALSGEAATTTPGEAINTVPSETINTVAGEVTNTIAGETTNTIADEVVNTVSSEVTNVITGEAKLSVTSDATNTVVDNITYSATDDVNNSGAARNVLGDEQLKALSDNLKAQPEFTSKEAQLFDESGNLKPDIKASDILKAVADYTKTSENITKEQLKDLFSNDSYKKLLVSAATDKWSLKPEDITKPDAVKNLYKKILEDTDNLERVIKSATENIDSKAAKAVLSATNEVKNNVSFMNDVNNLYTFVQIPIKLMDQKTNAELYVYQNKKGGHKEGDELTAFLHFDMEHLGSTDISIKLLNKNVSCNWYLEDDASLKLIEDNIDILEKRLNAKGYNAKMSYSSGEKHNDFVEDFIKQDEKKDGMVHRYSFDARA